MNAWTCTTSRYRHPQLRVGEWRVACTTSAKQGRDRKVQAILPLRGKILNVERVRPEKVLQNAEVGTLITAIGAGIGDLFNTEKIRYHKVVIMTDADVDGSHIRTLLLTFFARQMPQLIEKGFLYIAQPPLYGVRKGKKVTYVKDDDALARYLVESGTEGLVLRSEASATSVEKVRTLLLEQPRAKALVERAQRRGDGRVIAALARGTAMDRDTLLEEEKFTAELERLQAFLGLQAPDLLPLKWTIEDDAVHGRKRAVVGTRNGSGTRTLVDQDLRGLGGSARATGVDSARCSLDPCRGPWSMERRSGIYLGRSGL